MPRPNPDNWRAIRIGGPHHYSSAAGGHVQRIGTQGQPLTLEAILATPEQATIATNDATAERFTSAEIGPRWLLVLRWNSPPIIQGDGAV